MDRSRATESWAGTGKSKEGTKKWKRRRKEFDRNRVREEE